MSFKRFKKVDFDNNKKLFAFYYNDGRVFEVAPGIILSLRSKAKFKKFL